MTDPNNLPIDLPTITLNDLQPDAPEPTAPRRKPRSLSLSERATMIGLNLAGLSGTEIARRLDRDRGAVSKVLNSEDAKKAVDQAKSLLHARAAEYVDLHLLGVNVAAEKGETR